MHPPTPSREFLADQVRWAMGRGLPAQAAEDAVFESWERAAATFDASRGSFEAYMQRIVRNRCAYWWRTMARARRAEALVADPHRVDPIREERAADHQSALLEALTADERRIFSAWALQKHLGKGHITSIEVSRSIGLEPRAFENAKRRLKERLRNLLDRFGWSVGELLEGEDDVGRTG
jgi:DNA-directed RNA polymerase specialized sigma24 family protein